MSLDLAIREMIEEHLNEEGYCTRDEIHEIVTKATKHTKQLFESDLKELRAELKRIGDREEVMWDIIHPDPPNNPIKTWLSKLAFWR